MEDKNLRNEVRPLGMMDATMAPGSSQHTLHIVNREHVTIEGVLAVESFDDGEILLETDLGSLTLRGEELHIKQLDLDSGRFAVEGYISQCIYSTPRQRASRAPKAKGFLERLLR